jgi:hypothetical protein
MIGPEHVVGLLLGEFTTRMDKRRNRVSAPHERIIRDGEDSVYQTPCGRESRKGVLFLLDPFFLATGFLRGWAFGRLVKAVGAVDNTDVANAPGLCAEVAPRDPRILP